MESKTGKAKPQDIHPSRILWTTSPKKAQNKKIKTKTTPKKTTKQQQQQ